METTEKYFEEKLNVGFRVFRVDEVAQELALMEKCSRCGHWFAPDEMRKSYYQETVCRLCAVLLDYRVKSLSKGDRKSCPINPKKHIFTKEYHTSHGRGRG